MKAIVLSPVRSISDKPVSHRGAPAYIYKDTLMQTGKYTTVDLNNSHKKDWYKEDLNEYDEVWVYHGNDLDHNEMDVKRDGLNMPGGIESADAKSLYDLSQFKGKVYSIKCPFIYYSKAILARLEKARIKGSTYDPLFDQIDYENLSKMEEEAEVIKHPNMTNKLVIGDSHTICMYQPGVVANDIPFKTLSGALKEGLLNIINRSVKTIDFEEVGFYFGNIDVRHHFCRKDDPKADVKKKVENYIEQCLKLPYNKIKIYELLPIENESRKIPKSGYFLNEPFHGTWEERNEIKNYFNDLCEELCKDTKIEFIRWTKYLENNESELDFIHMEKPRSVHLARSSYPFWTGIEEKIERKQEKEEANLSFLFK